MPNCKIDPECEVPNNQKALSESFDKKFEELDIKVDCLDAKVNSVQNYQEIHNEKLTKIDTCLEKVSQTLHGDSEIGFNGMIKSQKDQNKKLEEMEKLMWFPKLIDDFWVNVKKPFYLIILTGIFSLVSFIILLKLGINPF